MFHALFSEGSTFFSRELRFLEGGAPNFRFLQKSESKMRLRRAWSHERKNQLNSCFKTILCQFWPQSKTLANIEVTKQTYGQQSIDASEEIFRKTKKKLQIKRRTPSKLNADGHTRTIQSSLLYIILYKNNPYVDSMIATWEM